MGLQVRQTEKVYYQIHRGLQSTKRLLLSLTLNLQGKGEFSMEFKNYSQAHPQTQAELAESYSGGAVGGGGAAASGKKAQKGRKQNVVCYVMK